MAKISICICTRNRQEGLKNLLESLDRMHITPDMDIRLIVVENDKENHTEKIINEFLTKSKFSISYFLEPRQGIAYARNRSVKEAYGSDFCCFVDDDQVVHPNWLVELVKCQREFNADGVWGSTPPLFNNNKIPSYIRQFHNPEIYAYGTIVKRAYTGCLLLRKELLDRINGPFDLRLNFTGGEDTYLTYLITNIGGVIRYTPNAIAYEIIPESRTTIKYIIKRTYRISNTGLFVESLIDKNKAGWNALPRLIMRFCRGLLIVFPFLLFGKSNKLIGIEKIADAVGGFLFILGSKNKFYK